MYDILYIPCSPMPPKVPAVGEPLTRQSERKELNFTIPLGESGKARALLPCSWKF
jgi:hypothetical protein